MENKGKRYDVCLVLKQNESIFFTGFIISNNYVDGNSIYNVDEVETQNTSLTPAQSISYNMYNKVSNITNTVGSTSKSMDFSYRIDASKYLTVYKQNNVEQYRKYDHGDYARFEYSSGTQKEMFYLGGGDGLAAVYVKESGESNELYFAVKDHLNSTWALINETGAIEEHYAGVYPDFSIRTNGVQWVWEKITIPMKTTPLTLPMPNSIPWERYFG